MFLILPIIYIIILFIYIIPFSTIIASMLYTIIVVIETVYQCCFNEYKRKLSVIKIKNIAILFM